MTLLKRSRRISRLLLIKSDEPPEVNFNTSEALTKPVIVFQQ